MVLAFLSVDCSYMNLLRTTVQDSSFELVIDILYKCDYSNESGTGREIHEISFVNCRCIGYYTVAWKYEFNFQWVKNKNIVF